LSSATFPQDTVLDGLSNVATSGPRTRLQLPQPGTTTPAPERSKQKGEGHVTALGFAYANAAARDGFQLQPFVFPVGSIIVRERLLGASSTPDQLVVMIKHEPDFNRKAGGWEFVAVSGDMKKIVKREKDGKCLECHATAANNDFVFPEDGRYR
jgi:hypothetical protein